MKNIKVLFSIVITTVILISCKDTEEKKAEVILDKYKLYIDSVQKMATIEVLRNWKAIDSKHVELEKTSEIAIKSVEKNSNLMQRFEKYVATYEDFKTHTLAEQNNTIIFDSNHIKFPLLQHQNQKKIEDFSNLNAKNLLKAYQNFIATILKNKATYSTEDWKELKQLYNQLDFKKRKLKKEGLSETDQIEIKKIQDQFISLYPVNQSLK